MNKIVLRHILFFSFTCFCPLTATTDNFTLRSGLSFNLNQIHTDRLIEHTNLKDDGSPEDETKAIGSEQIKLS